MLAARLSCPVSSTAARIGELMGEGLASGDHTVHFGPLVKTFVNPLFLSTLIPIAVGALMYFLLKGVRLVHKGQKMSGRFCPVLLAPGKVGVAEYTSQLSTGIGPLPRTSQFPPGFS